MMDREDAKTPKLHQTKTAKSPASDGVIGTARELNQREGRGAAVHEAELKIPT
jgi:hypothetical protein